MKEKKEVKFKNSSIVSRNEKSSLWVRKRNLYFRIMEKEYLNKNYTKIRWIKELKL